MSIRTASIRTACAICLIFLAAIAPSRAQEQESDCIRLSRDIGNYFERLLDTTMALPGRCTWTLDGGQGPVTVVLQLEQLKSDTEARKLMHFARLEQGTALEGLGGGGFSRKTDEEFYIEAIKDRWHFRFYVRPKQMNYLVERQAIMFAQVVVNKRF